MSDVLATSIKNPIHMGESGNVGGTQRYRHRTSAMTNGDVVVFGKIPAGATLTDWQMANTASSASTTMSLGIRNADGTTTSPVDGDATARLPGAAVLLPATAISAAARTRAGAPGTVANQNGLTLGPFSKDVLLIGTLGGAAIATDTIIEVQATYLCEGVK